MRAGLVLAAGGSRRFGRADKLLASLHGRPILLHTIDRARESGVRRIYVVTKAARVARLVRSQPGLVAIRARDAAQGLSASLAAGLKAMRPIEREVLIFLGDMPFAGASRALRLHAGSKGSRPVWRGRPGHPMLVRVSAARGTRIAGDSGLGGLGDIVAVRGTAGNLCDIDGRAALRRARLGSGAAPGR